MGPAKAMGTFVRVWRSEWAGLTRAQLAIALHGVSPKTKGVTSHVIRRWEDGQPPATIERLQALLKVMRSHGLTAQETEQFRQVVFAACADRQYPGLLDQGLEYRADVDAVAHWIWHQQEKRAGGVNLVSLVAAVEALDTGLKAHLRPTHPGSPWRKQAAALAYLRGCLAKWHGLSDRYAQVVRTTDANAQLLDAHFGSGGLGDDYLLCGLGQRLMGAERRVGRLPDSFGRLLALAEEAMARGHQAIAQDAMYSAMECLGHEPSVTVGDLRYHWQRVLGWPLSLAEPADDNPWNRWHLFHACLHAGDLGAAEDHLLALLHWRDDRQVRGCVWHMRAAALALRRGRRDEATRPLETALRLAETGGFVRAQKKAQALLAECTRAYTPAPRNSRTPTQVRAPR